MAFLKKTSLRGQTFKPFSIRNKCYQNAHLEYPKQFYELRALMRISKKTTYYKSMESSISAIEQDL